MPGRFPEGTGADGPGNAPPGETGERSSGEGTGDGSGEPRPRLIMGGPGGEIDRKLLDYLERNQGSATWLVAVDSAQSAASAILSTGRPVIAMGGFSGSDPAMSVSRIKELVSTGRLRYVLPGGGPGGPGGPGGLGGRGNSEALAWVQANCAVVPAAEYGGTGDGRPLYRCG